jgi:hypothetical protein
VYTHPLTTKHEKEFSVKIFEQKTVKTVGTAMSDKSELPFENNGTPLLSFIAAPT